MGKIEPTWTKFIFGILISILTTAGGFIINDMKKSIDDKVSNEILHQYIKMSNDSWKLYFENEKEREVIQNKRLEKLENALFQIDNKYMDIDNVRGEQTDINWDYDALVTFAEQGNLTLNDLPLWLLTSSAKHH